MSEMITVNFVKSDGVTLSVKTEVGVSLLQLAHEHGIEIEGACEGNMACSTCHLILTEEWFDRIPQPSEEEEDMLDLAIGLTATSRLGCQIHLTPDMDGLTVNVPPSALNSMGF